MNIPLTIPLEKSRKTIELDRTGIEAIQDRTVDHTTIIQKLDELFGHIKSIDLTEDNSLYTNNTYQKKYTLILNPHYNIFPWLF